MNRKQVAKFMADKKQLIGWGNWEFIIVEEEITKPEAQIEPSKIGQQFVLTLPKVFFTYPQDKQENILLHEFVHGRYSQFLQRVEKIQEDEEEDMVNDITTLMQYWKK